MIEKVTACAGLPERRGEPKETMAEAVCKKCGGEIWPGESYGLDGRGLAVCLDCAEDRWRRLGARDKLRLLGYEPAAAGRDRRRERGLRL